MLRNAVDWARPEAQPWLDSCPNVPAEQLLEKLTPRGGSIHEPGKPGLR